jgi:1-deoxy-D-xylulose-5-phosphate synthase
LFDIAYLRGVPGLVHMQPKDEDEFVDMLWTMAAYEKGPIAVRYPRGSGPGARPKSKPALLEIGRGELVEDGQDVGLIGLGDLFAMAQQTRDELLKQGLSVALVNPRFIKPLDRELIVHLAKKVRVICTFEDHVLMNGFGTAVMELLAEERITTPVVRVGWPDEFIEHGSVPVLRAKHGLSVNRALELIGSTLRL